MDVDKLSYLHCSTEVIRAEANTHCSEKLFECILKLFSKYVLELEGTLRDHLGPCERSKQCKDIVRFVIKNTLYGF